MFGIPRAMCSLGHFKNSMGYVQCTQGYVEDIMGHVPRGMLRLSWDMVDVHRVMLELS